MKRFVLILGMAMCFVAHGHAQNAFDKFRMSIHEDFNDFRRECMKEFVAFVRNPWKEFKEEQPVPMPKEETVPPVVMPIGEEDALVEDKPVVIDEVIAPVVVEPRPEPIEPIKEVPVVKEETVSFQVFGTPVKIRKNVGERFSLKSMDENSIADVLDLLSGQAYDNVVYDCLSQRDALSLCDWAYLHLLKAMSEEFCGKGTNESVLLMAYVYMQSGYKMRLAMNGDRLYMLYASRHQIYDSVSYEIGGENYYGLEELPSRLYVCNAVFPEEKGLSLCLSASQKFTKHVSTSRYISSKKYPEITVSVSVNKNLMDFYNTYPTSMVDGNFMTRWAIYANSPLDNEVAEQMYPVLRDKLKGLSQLEAVSRLLDFVQTGFEYEYDDKVWGCDRAFFSEESLYYPYCDCEDRSILFTRLVRDLLGLKCILIYYPGHLASAVEFTETGVTGDYVLLDGRKFIVADGTYINAPVGRTMPGMNNSTAKAILLE